MATKDSTSLRSRRNNLAQGGASAASGTQAMRLKINYRARFSGRQNMIDATVSSPTKAGAEILWASLPRAALRSTSFRCACPGLNSSACYAGSLNDPVPRAFWLAFEFLLLIFVLAGCSSGIHSATGGWPPTSTSSPAAISSSAQVVKVSTSPVSIPANASADAVVTLSISPGFHINANPATFPYLIATELVADKTEGISASKPIYPAAEKKKFEFAEQPLAVYERERQIKLPLRAQNNSVKGVRSLPIHVRVQACDNEKCYPPVTLDAMIPVEVE